MTGAFFSPAHKIWFEPGITVIRVITGLFLAYHGWEVFDGKLMGDSAKWLTDLHFPKPALMAYLGKSTEFITGILITIGLLTRLAVWPVIVLMLTIIFGMGHGKIFYEDQHPFMFILVALVLFFNGPGRYSADQYLFGSNKHSRK